MNKVRFLSILLITLAGFAVYHASLENSFLWDDIFIVQENPNIKSWSCLAKIFTEDAGNVFSKKFILYRPIQTLSYAADYSIWKLDAAGYHFTNILLHILTAIAVWALASLLFEDGLIGLITGALFVIHPIHTEAVAYVSGRADILSGLFMLTCIICYIKQLSLKSAAGYFLMLSSYTLALLSNEYSLILPFLLVLYHYTFKKRFRLREILPIVLIAAAYIPTRISVSPSLAPNIAYYHAILKRAPGFFAAITNYIRLLILPFDLHMEYGNTLFAPMDPRAIAGILIVCALISLVFIKRGSSRLVFFSISWFLVGLLPYSGIYPLNAYMAEHWLYLASIGFFLMMAGGIRYLSQKKEFRIAALAFFALFVFFYSYLTIEQNEYWRGPITFYNRTLVYAPASARIYNNLGTEYRKALRYDDAIALYKKAIGLDPKYEIAYTNLAITYDAFGRKADAAESFKMAIKSNPLYPAPYVGLGLMREGAGGKEEAASLFRKAIAVDPSYASAYVNLGFLYSSIGKNDCAIALFRKAIKIDPNCDTAAIIYTYLGNAYSDIGDKRSAASSYQKAIEADPLHAQAYNNLGIVMHDMGRTTEAIPIFRKAMEIDPRLVSSYVNLGNAYSYLGDSDKAIAIYKRAIALDPARADARSNLEIEYRRRGQ